jgi:hypothetical protein
MQLGVVNAERRRARRRRAARGDGPLHQIEIARLNVAPVGGY